MRYRKPWTTERERKEEEGEEEHNSERKETRSVCSTRPSFAHHRPGPRKRDLYPGTSITRK